MKEIKLYRCEICGTQYNERNAAINCENAHEGIKEIRKCRYKSKFAYPETVEITFSNGSVVMYNKGKTL